MEIELCEACSLEMEEGESRMMDSQDSDMYGLILCHHCYKQAEKDMDADDVARQEEDREDFRDYLATH